MIGIHLAVKFKTKVMDAATGNVVKESPWRSNLVLDNGLNSMTGNGIANTFANIIVGSGTNANSFASGGTLFTQVGTTITATGNFFTTAMVGGIFKYGTGSGGSEYYIVTFISATQVVVDTSATVAVGVVATVWQVQQTALQTFIRASNSYITTGASCGTTFSGNVSTMQRTFMVNQVAGTYSVNEIGWNNLNLGNPTNNCFGRIVLPSTDVVGPTNFYVVVMQLTATWTPATPQAVTNVGTGLNTAGTLMIENFDAQQVSSSGGTVGNATMDFFNAQFAFITSSYSQNGTLTGTSSLAVGSIIAISITGNTKVKVGGQRGTYTLTSPTPTLTGTGQTIFGVCLVQQSGINPTLNVVIDVLFTTPQTLPTGLYQPNMVFQLVYNRTLVN